MKLAEALSERKALIGKMASLRLQSTDTFVWDEDSQVKVKTKETEEVCKQLESLAVRLTELIAKINFTNNTSMVEFNDTEMSLMVAIANKDSRVILASQLNSLRSEVSNSGRYDERTKHTLDTAYLDNQIRDLQDEIRALDLKIQEANWQFNLVE